MVKPIDHGALDQQEGVDDTQEEDAPGNNVKPTESGNESAPTSLPSQDVNYQA